MENKLEIAQYKSFSEHRLHFNRLYFAVVAFVLFVSFGFVAILFNANMDWLGLVILFSTISSFSIIGGYIAFRH